ncbi:unnamed protein product, partial [Ixodes pacificus]
KRTTPSGKTPSQEGGVRVRVGRRAPIRAPGESTTGRSGGDGARSGVPDGTAPGPGPCVRRSRQPQEAPGPGSEVPPRSTRPRSDEPRRPHNSFVAVRAGMWGGFFRERRRRRMRAWLGLSGHGGGDPSRSPGASSGLLAGGLRPAAGNRRRGLP